MMAITATAPLAMATRAGLAAVGLAGAAWFGMQVVPVNLERSCSVGDTPYFELCPALPSGEKQVPILRSRIASSPGDSAAYLRLALTDKTAARAKALEAARQLAPSNPNVQALAASTALEQQDIPRAIEPLVGLAERGSDKAALVLARLVMSGQGKLLEPHVLPGSKWLSLVLAVLPNAPGQFSAALPLVTLGIDKHVLQPEELKTYIRYLKSAGAWADAYGVWVALHRRTLPLLYNGGFDEAFKEDGFDWELSAQHPVGRVGAIADRHADEQRGTVLNIRFTGRPIEVPLLRQNVFVGDGWHRLRGDYKATQLKMEHGLVWVLRCMGSAMPIAKSAPLTDTGKSWQPFNFEFAVPPACGRIATLALETSERLDATLGSRGTVWLDALNLERLDR
jgi:hypothetical protein